MGSVTPDSSKVFAFTISAQPRYYSIGAEWQFAPKLLPKWYLHFNGMSSYIGWVGTPNLTAPNGGLTPIKKMAYFTENTLSIQRQLGKMNRRFFFDNAYFGLYTSVRFRPRFAYFAQQQKIPRIYIGPRIGFNQRVFHGLYVGLHYQQPLVIYRTQSETYPVFAIQVNPIILNLTYRFPIK